METVAHASTTSPVLDASDVRRAVTRIAHEITERNHGSAGLLLVGIHTRGVPLAQRLGAVIGHVEGDAPPVGALDISLFRDDLRVRPTGRMGGTDLPVDPSGATVVLVDDVLYTGRSIRAALEALHHLGRPAAVQLAVLVDRGHRELPIRPDYVGKNLPTAAADRIRVRLEEVDGEDGVWMEQGVRGIGEPHNRETHRPASDPPIGAEGVRGIGEPHNRETHRPASDPPIR